MSGNAEQQLNVAKLSKMGRAQRTKALILTLASLAIFVFFWFLPTLEPGETPDQARENRTTKDLGCLLFGAFAVVGLVLFLDSFTVYYWNGKVIRRTRFRRTRLLRLDDVVSFQIRRLGGDFTYILTDKQGERFAVPVAKLGKDSPLHEALTQKLAHLEKDRVTEVEATGEGRFPYRVLGLRMRTFVVRNNLLLERGVLRRREIRLDEVSEVYQRLVSLKHVDTEVVSRRGARIRIDSLWTQEYDTLIAYITRHTPNAAWVNLTGLEPEGHREKVAYLKGTIQSARAATRVDWVYLAAMLIVVAYMIGPVVAQAIRGLKNATDIEWFLIRLALLAIFIAMSTAALILPSGRRFRDLRRLRVKLAEVEAEAKRQNETESSHVSG